MEVKSVEKKEHSTVEVVMEFGPEEFDTAVNHVYLRNRKKIAIPGFRKGKVPRKIIENMYGADIFYDDAIWDLFPTAYAQMLIDEKLDAEGYPDVSVESAGPEGAVLKVTVTVRPEVKLGQYKGLVAPKAEATVTEGDLDAELRPLIARATRMVDVDREAREGDVVLVDYEGFKDGEPIPNSRAEKQNLQLGSHTLIPGFEEQLVGMRAGDEKEFKITFPEDYTPELAGQEVVFKAKVNAVKVSVTPKLDDEFAKDVSEFETLEELKEDLRNQVLERKRKQVDRDFRAAVMDQLLSKMEVEIPDSIVQFRAENMMDNYRRRIEMTGIPYEQYTRMVGVTPESLQQDALQAALEQYRHELAMQEVAKAENIEVTQEEIDAEVKRMSREEDRDEEEIRDTVDMDELEFNLLMEKAAQFVIDNAIVGDPETAESEEKPEEETDGAEKTEPEEAADAQASDAPEEPAQAEETAGPEESGAAEKSAEPEEPAAE